MLYKLYNNKKFVATFYRYSEALYYAESHYFSDYEIVKEEEIK
jgi:hypothetical protein